MLSEAGFASPVEEGTETVVGGEGDSAEPKVSYDRSPLKVLSALEERPLQQAMKAIEYIDAAREKQRKILKACTPAALNLIAQNGPEYLSAVQASA